jgi:PHP family Zn ribbon phosphoesterase
MSPSGIIQAAKLKNLDIIGITDHNSTKHCNLVKKLGEENGIFVLTGAEISTREEVHCLTFFDNSESLDDFQHYIENWLPYVKNKPAWFGYQVVVDEFENILEEVDSLLIVGLNQSISDVRMKVAELGGLFIPAHVNRPSQGIYSQLGFIPDGLSPDAIEIFAPVSKEEAFRKYPELLDYCILRNSDAHQIERIGAVYSEFFMEDLTFAEIRKAFKGEDGRKVRLI